MGSEIFLPGKECLDLPGPVLLAQAPGGSAGARVSEASQKRLGFWGSLCVPELPSDAILGEARKQKADILEGEAPSPGGYFLWTKDI